MEEREYLDESQRAMKAARLVNLLDGVRKDHAQGASIEAHMSQAEAAKKFRVGRSSVQRATNVLRNGTPELVEAVDGGLIPVSTASRLLVLPENEQVKITTADNPRQAARQAVRRLGMKRRGSIDPTRLCEELTSIFEKTPAVEMQDMVRLFLDQRATSYEQRERLAESARACAARVADLASRIEEPNLCAYQYCGRVYGRRRNKHAPGAKYCSPVCAARAGEPSARNGP
jgi:hypothetical protein